MHILSADPTVMDEVSLLPRVANRALLTSPSITDHREVDFRRRKIDEIGE
jgi:hypothetical protein